jgi:hypothetical protein
MSLVSDTSFEHHLGEGVSIFLPEKKDAIRTIFILREWKEDPYYTGRLQ